jgi:hypothetical protein
VAVFNRHMPGRPPTVAVISDDRRVGRALVAYLSSDGSPAGQVIGPYTYQADQEQFRHAEAVVCDLDGCDLAAAFHLMERAVAQIPVFAISASPARGATSCAEKTAVALEELIRQLTDLPASNRNEAG